MRESRSEIFEAFTKLAEEKGLFKTAAEEKKSKKDKESPELKKYKSEVYARVSSDDISTIEALYGVKPESIKGMEYEHNIAEVAHPNAVVVAPSYDKINALVENINERQKIIINKIFVSKAPSGTSDMFLKDAEKELAMQLIRIGNDMDNADQEEIRILADECLEGLKKNAGLWDDISDFAHKAVDSIGGNKGEKTLNDATSVGTGALEGAAAGALIGAVVTSWGVPLSLVGAGLGGLLGGIAGGVGAYLFNTGSKVKNIELNTKSLYNQLGDLKKSCPEEAAFFAQIEETVNNINVASSNYMKAINIIRAKEIKGEEATPAEIQEIKNDTKIFVDLIGKFDKVRSIFKKKIKEGSFAKALNSTPGLDDDIQDVDKEFDSIAVTIDNLKASMNGVVQKAVAVVEAKQPTTDGHAAQPTADSKKESAPKEDHWYDIFQKMVGHKPDEKEVNFFNSFPETQQK